MKILKKNLQRQILLDIYNRIFFFFHIFFINVLHRCTPFHRIFCILKPIVCYFILFFLFLKLLIKIDIFSIIIRTVLSISFYSFVLLSKLLNILRNLATSAETKTSQVVTLYTIMNEMSLDSFQEKYRYEDKIHMKKYKPKQRKKKFERWDLEEGNLKPVKQYFMNSSDEESLSTYAQRKEKLLQSAGVDNDQYPYNDLKNIFNRKLNRKYKNVFDRLTDTNFYTGIHKERFDELGNGRGLAGNENIFLIDGWTETATRTHEVYSTVIKKNRNPVVTPGTLGMQKYGIQIAAPKNIWLYRNGDKYHSGLLFLVKPHIMNFNSLLFEITKVLSPIIGPVRKIYDQNFRVVKKIEQLVDGAKYLCTSGEPPAPLDKLEIFLSKWVIQE